MVSSRSLSDSWNMDISSFFYVPPPYLPLLLTGILCPIEGRVYICVGGVARTHTVSRLRGFVPGPADGLSRLSLSVRSW